MKKMIDEDFAYLQKNTKEGVVRKEDAFSTPDGGRDWTCNRCGNQIQGFQLAFSIHDGYSMFGSHSGSGRCHYVTRPYCPNCDGKEAEKLGYKFHAGCIDC